jgi:moderate conductance mechanosensitive channel
VGLICRAMTPARLFAALGLLACVLLAMGEAQAAGTAAAPAAAPAATPAPVSVGELQHLVDALQNDQQRAQLVQQLQALIAAQRGVEQKPQAQKPVGWFNTLSAQIDTISSEIVEAAAVVLDAPRLIDWFRDQASDAEARARWLGITYHLVTIFGAALLADGLVRLALRRLRARLAARTTDGLLTKLVTAVLLLMVEALPVLAFAAAAYFVLPVVRARFTSSHVAEVIVQATLTARLILAAAHVALLSAVAGDLYALGDETRNYLYIWVRRFTNWAVYGLALASATWWMGVPGAIYMLLLRGTMLVLGILSVIFVLQNRTAVADLLRGKPSGEGGGKAVPGHGWYVLRQRLADTWHVLAIIYLIGTFGTYVLNVEGGFAFVFRATLLSLVVLVAAGVIVRSVRRLSERGFAISADLKHRFPGIETRANRYLPVLTWAASIIVYVFALLALLQAWGVGTFAWFNTDTGRRITGAVVSIATVLVVALVVWEAFGSAIERYLNGVGVDGRRVARSARTRTLVPLMRTTVFIVLVTIVGLVVLSELGVNIAPLLAGAGIAGIAVGFGAQALVKDVITGLFILLEDTLAVGEMVDVGSNHVGIVEAISVRTIRLRDVGGVLHTVPFSDVTTVRNLTRDYSYFVADVGVLYATDPDQVMAVLRDVADGMCRDPDWASAIVEPLEIWGVDRFTDSAMVIRARLKTVPLRQFTVGREFNRRMKKAFDEHGIEMPASNQTHYLPVPPVPPASA